MERYSPLDVLASPPFFLVDYVARMEYDDGVRRDPQQVRRLHADPSRKSPVTYRSFDQVQFGIQDHESRGPSHRLRRKKNFIRLPGSETLNSGLDRSASQGTRVREIREVREVRSSSEKPQVR